MVAKLTFAMMQGNPFSRDGGWQRHAGGRQDCFLDLDANIQKTSSTLCWRVSTPRNPVFTPTPWHTMAEYFINAVYPDFVAQHVPAMPLEAIEIEPGPHREHEPIEQPEPEPMIAESVDPMALAAEFDDDDAPADNEGGDHESKEEKLRREAVSLEHLTLHDRKNPFCEFCQRGRMLK